MKLCRFELKAEPGRIRSGMVFSGKVYETDGATAVAVYEAEMVRPLAPIPQAPSIRILRSDLQPLPGTEDAEPRYFYGNPSCLVGASQTLPLPPFTSRVTFEPYLAAVLVSGGYRVDLQDCDDLILGFTLINMLVARGPDGTIYGRGYDIGAAIGPVITTPEELIDETIDAEMGRRFALSTVVRVNGVERNRGNVQDLPFTFAEAISTASQSCPVREGDVFAMGPIVDPAEDIWLDADDEVQVSAEKLGTLSLKVSGDL